MVVFSAKLSATSTASWRQKKRSAQMSEWNRNRHESHAKLLSTDLGSPD
jgi:hypothetical protein